MKFEEINTERTILRKADPESISYIHANWTDEQLLNFYGLEELDALNKEKERVKVGLQTSNRSFLYFHILDKTRNNVIGWCGFHTWYLDHDRAEIGYGLSHDKNKGKGIMSEALLTVINYGFDKMGLHRIEAFIGEDNEASLKLVHKFGFQREGILKEHYLVNGVYEDSIVYGLTK